MGLGLLLALVLLSKIKVHLKYFRQEEDDTVSLEFFLFAGLIHYKLELPVLIFQKEKSGVSLKTRTELETGGKASREITGKPGEFKIESLEEAITKFREWWLLLQNIKIDIERFLRRIHLQHFYWTIRIGTPDAAATGLLTGLIWAAMGGITSYLFHRVSSEGQKPVLKVDPDFRKQGFSTSFDCIFKIRVGHIMVTGIKILIKMVYRRGVKHFGRASHSRSNENCHGEYQGNG